jgi:hypothetical protein
MENFEQRLKPPVTKEERELKREKDRLAAEQALADRRQADAAFQANFRRLRAERLWRESK